MGRETEILTLLDQKSGNVREVASILDLSVSYVSRIQKKYRQTIPSALVPLPDQQIDKPVLPEIATLRDKTIEKIEELMTQDLMGSKDLVRLLDILLKFETAKVSKVKPAAVYNDNRVQLVDQLGDLTLEQLQALAGDSVADDPFIVEIPNDD